MNQEEIKENIVVNKREKGIKTQYEREKEEMHQREKLLMQQMLIKEQEAIEASISRGNRQIYYPPSPYMMSPLMYNTNTIPQPSTLCIYIYIYIYVCSSKSINSYT